MGQLFANNVATVLSSNITNTQTTITVNSTARFPVVGGVDDWFYLTIANTGAESNWEIVKVIAWSGTSVNVVRGQQGTTAASWLAGSKVELRTVASDLQSYTNFVDSKGANNGLAPLVGTTVPTANLPSYVNAAVQTALDTKVNNVVTKTNAMHALRQDSWVQYFDGTVTGAIQLKIEGLYGISLSGGMELLVTQNDVNDSSNPDYLFYVAGNWRTADKTWHNVEARVDTVSNDSINIRYCNDTSNVYILLGDTTSVWKYPRIVIRDMITNTVAGQYVPTFTISMTTSLPATVQKTLTVRGTGSLEDFNTAFDLAAV